MTKLYLILNHSIAIKHQQIHFWCDHYADCVSLSQMVTYEGKLEVHLKELSELTKRVVMLETSADSYIKLDFELLRIELREFEALVTQLKDSLNSSSPMFDSLYTEVGEMFVFFFFLTYK